MIYSYNRTLNHEKKKTTSWMDFKGTTLSEKAYLKCYTLFDSIPRMLYNILEVTKLHKWRTDEWLPRIRGVHRKDASHGHNRAVRDPHAGTSLCFSWGLFDLSLTTNVIIYFLRCSMNVIPMNT